MVSGRTRLWVHYGVAVLASCTALLVEQGLTRAIGPGLPTFLFFYPAVVLVALFSGLGPGLLATLTSALLVDYFVLPPVEGFAIASPVDLLSLVLFAWMGTGISLGAGWYHRTRDRAARPAAEVAGPGTKEPRSPHAPLGRGGASGPAPRPAPLRRWLLLLVLGTAGPLLAFTLVVLVWLVGGYRADQERRHTDTTRALGLAVDAEIRSWKAALQALASSQNLQQGRLAAFYEEASRVAARHGGWIALYDASSQHRLNTLRPFGDPLPPTGSPEMLKAIFRDRQPIVSDLTFGAVAQRPIVGVAVPVVREGQVIYSLHMGFGPERLVRLLADQRFPPTWIAAINDGHQRVVARAPDQPDRRGQPVVPPIARVFAAQTSGLLDAAASDGRTGRIAFQRLREAPWTVSVMVPVAELQAAWQRPLLAFLLLGGLAVFGAVGLAVGLARRIARPVTEATRLAAQVIQGQSPPLVPSGIAEVAALQDALIDSAATVRMATQAREAATAALRQANETLEHRAAQLQTLSGDLVLAEERERHRLAQVLHDGLQQLLVAARLRVHLLGRTDPNRLPDMCKEVLTLLDEAVTSSRSLSAELSPPILYSRGFVPALEWLARWMADRHHLTVTVQADPELAVPTVAAQVLLFQAVRELLFNVVKHAGVSEATVEVCRADGQLQITVADQGAGFDLARLQPGSDGGLGLPSIRQRLEYLGGTLAITSARSQGSRFTLSIPLPQT